MVRVALLQLQLQKNPAHAMEHVVKLLKTAGAAGSNIVCLPEQWFPKPITYFEKEFGQIIDTAKEHKMIIIAGAFLERVSDNMHISCPVIAGDGKILGRQLKIHPYGDEKKAVKAGNKVEIFDSGTFKFGIGVCHDVVFPEVSRALARKGADMLFFPSRIRNEGIEPWQMYVQVRALENRVPAAAPNACSKAYGGKSLVVDFDYDKKTNIATPKQALASVNEQILMMDVDLERARKIRKLRFEDVKTDLYSSL
ncbi:MAG: carbon-nitrogen hydrolase family protein [Nitrososphaerales archaeon]